MTRVVHKFELRLGMNTIVEVSGKSRVVLVAFQGVTPFIWIEHDPDAKVRRQVREFFIYGTGSPIYDPSLKHIGSMSHHDIHLVWHVYEKCEGAVL